MIFKQLQPKYQNRHFHTPAANSLLLQKEAWHITTHFVVEGHKYDYLQELQDYRPLWYECATTLAMCDFVLESVKCRLHIYLT